MFKCQECGSEDLMVERIYGANQEGEYITFRAWGWLDELHHVEWEEHWEVVERGAGDPSLVEEGEVDPEFDEWYVRCGGCDREIEFGWSHPDGGGRIWPAEAEDFNPWKTWPEPRYREAWEKRGWLRPDM